MKALILAGGLGTRMRPLTFTRPKHLLPIANVPHIEHVLRHLLQHGVDEIVLLTSYLADAFEPTIGRARDEGIRLHVVTEDPPLGTAGALKNAEDLLGDETFVALNGDILTDADLSGLVAYHRSTGAAVTLLLTPVDDPSAFGVVPTDDDGRVLGFVEKPEPGSAPTDLVNAGVYVMEPELLTRIPPGVVVSAEHEVFPGLAAEGVMFALRSDDYWMDVGTPDKYLRANLDLVAGRCRLPWVDRDGDGRAVVAPGASVSGVVEWSCVGAGVAIEDGASVRRSVLLPDAVVGAGARVERSVLGEGAIVPAGAVVEDTVLADGERAGG